jgi:hypothetical protein
VFASRRQPRPRASRVTDWDAYYRRAGFFTPLTRRLTERVVLREVAAALQNRPVEHVVELGGGNSSFLAAFRTRYPAARLTAIDTNAVGLERLAARLTGDPRLAVVQTSVLDPSAETLAADVVFSIGLIEHFDAAGTAQAIRAHFEHARAGAVVLITYPTPTWLYRSVRGAAELFGIWAFPDERPLGAVEVVGEAARHGRILRSFVHWPIVLTQGVVVAKKHQRM